MECATKMAIVEALADVAVKLLNYCGADCANPWACDGCAILSAKKDIERLQCGIHLPELTATLEPAESMAMELPNRHLFLVKGGRID